MLALSMEFYCVDDCAAGDWWHTAADMCVPAFSRGYPKQLRRYNSGVNTAKLWSNLFHPTNSNDNDNDNNNNTPLPSGGSCN
jgi:hypothetical protein